MNNKLLHLFLLILFMATACSEKQVAPKNNSSFQLKDSKLTGIDFSNKLDKNGKLNIIEYLYFYNGGGVGLGDLNGDGLEDIYFTANQGKDQLYLNKGDLTFEEVSEASGINDDGSWSTGVSIDDINGDGHLDIYVCKVGTLPLAPASHNRLYINDGQGNFSEKSEAYGLNFSGFSTQSCFIDYDQDGDLDMYLLNHAVHSVRSYGDTKKRTLKDPISGDRFYENRLKEEGKFVEVTEQAGIYNSPLGYGLAITASDVNNDGWVDLYIGNDFHENDYLYINNGDKTFTESIKQYFSHTSQFSMGVDIADMNQDGWLDVFTTDMMPFESDVVLKSGGEDTDQIKRIKKDLGFELQNARNHFQLNQGNGQFSDVAFMTKTFATDWSWSVLLQDFDNNGSNDIFITNGIVSRPNDLDYINYLNANPEGASIAQLIEQMPSQPLSNVLFAQNEDKTFSELQESFVGPPSFSNGSAYADLDQDGDLDIVVNNINQKAFVLENTVADKNYLAVVLESAVKNTTVKGTKVSLHLGDKLISKELQTTKGFMSSSTHRLFFGLDAAQQIDSITIHWPGKQYQVLKNIQANQSLKIKQENTKPGLGEMTQAANNKSYETFVLPFKHEENKFYDEDAEKLVPKRYGYEGPALICEDLNGDGIKDIYMGAGRNHPASLLFGNKSGSYTNQVVPDFKNDAKYEDIDAATLDFDGDGDKDIYVVSGGNDNNELDKILEDRIYLNNNGVFKRIPISLPHTNGSCVSIADFNKDGFDDIFVGASTIPGSYGLSPYSFILKNLNGQGVDIAEKVRYGMVKDATWVDLEGDKDMDLVICGDWMPIRVFENDKGAFSEKTKEYNLQNSHGLWNTLEFTDLNGDGRVDMLAGNAGANLKWQASVSEPVKMFVGDFDKNGFTEPIVFYNYFGRYLPFSSLDKLSSQLPMLKKQFTSYESFKNISSIEGLLPDSDSLIVESKQISELRSMVYLSTAEGFTGYPLTGRAQTSSINDFEIADDGKIFYVGNNPEYVAELGPSLANPGGVFWNFDKSSKSFQRMESLPLPNQLNAKRIVNSAAKQFFVVSNGGYPYILSEK